MVINRTVLLLAFALLAIVAITMERRTLAERGEFGVREVKGRPGTVMLTWDEAIEFPMAEKLEAAYQSLRASNQRFVINLDSGGGSLTEGGRVIDVIERMQRTHDVETRVANFRNCLSMCVPIFLQGTDRLAGERARFMFHQPISIDGFTGEVVEQRPFDRDRASTKFFDEFFVESEMDPTWREQLRKDWVGREVWKTGRELVQEGSNIVTGLI